MAEKLCFRSCADSRHAADERCQREADQEISA